MVFLSVDVLRYYSAGQMPARRRIRNPVGRLKMRKFQQLAAIVGVLVIGSFGLQSAAGAAAGYPGTATTVNLGTLPVGQSFSATLCGYASGAIVSVEINGQTESSATADSSGCVTLSGVVSDPHVSVDGGTPIAVTTGATDVITGAGVNSAGQTITGTATLIVAAAATPASSTTGTGSSGLAFTGADIMAMVVGGLGLIALGFLTLTFSRRRIKTVV
jgi:hypothetical protein